MTCDVRGANIYAILLHIGSSYVCVSFFSLLSFKVTVELGVPLAFILWSHCSFSRKYNTASCLAFLRPSPRTAIRRVFLQSYLPGEDLAGSQSLEGPGCGKTIGRGGAPVGNPTVAAEQVSHLETIYQVAPQIDVLNSLQKPRKLTIVTQKVCPAHLLDLCLLNRNTPAPYAVQVGRGCVGLGCRVPVPVQAQG